MKINNHFTSTRTLTKNFAVVRDDVAVERHGKLIEESAEKGEPPVMDPEEWGKIKKFLDNALGGGVKKYKAKVGNWVVECVTDSPHVHECLKRNFERSDSEPTAKVINLVNVTDKCVLKAVKGGPGVVYSPGERTYLIVNTDYYDETRKGIFGMIEEILMDGESTWLPLHALSGVYVDESKDEKDIMFLPSTETDCFYSLMDFKKDNKFFSSGPVYANLETLELINPEHEFYISASIVKNFPHYIPFILTQYLENVELTEGVTEKIEGYRTIEEIAYALSDFIPPINGYFDFNSEFNKNNKKITGGEYTSIYNALTAPDARAIINPEVLFKERVERITLNDIILTKKDFDDNIVLMELSASEAESILASANNIQNYDYSKKDIDSYPRPLPPTTEPYFNPYLLIKDIDGRGNFSNLDEKRTACYRKLLEKSKIHWLNTRLPEKWTQFCIRKYLEEDAEFIRIVKGSEDDENSTNIIKGLGLTKRRKPHISGRREMDMVGLYKGEQKDENEGEVIKFCREFNLVDLVAFNKRTEKITEYAERYNGATVYDFLMNHRNIKAAELFGIGNKYVLDWIEKMNDLCKPDKIVFCDGSEEEKMRLQAEAFEDENERLIELNREELPGCALHRTAVNDVARTEHLTYICTTRKEDAGPTNNWMSPDDAYKELGGYFDGSMKGRTMYVVPFIMGVPGSQFNKIGVELTDSIYVVLNMRIMTQMGDIAWKELGNSDEFTKCLHGKADLDMDKRRICHFPEDNTIWSVNSGYGGNVLLGKKCLALRIASYMGRRDGWMAEHMLIMGIENPQGEIFYIAAAFPSACGKTNLAMLIPPDPMKGYKIWTLGDDIAWMRVGDDGRLWAVNPEAGFFGVVPGTNSKTNPNAVKMIKRNTIFTNVLLKEDKTVWWEGADEDPPARGINWRGEPWNPMFGKYDKRYAAHPNSRFTAPISQCPAVSPESTNPKGVPISAIIFGGRRPSVAPLVYESFNWQHGVFVGASMASETTIAQIGEVGILRRDPMAMLPFCGYNMGDYFAHWLKIGKNLKTPPRIFHVNWFGTDTRDDSEKAKFLWRGFGENLRVLEWIVKRCAGSANAKKTPIGYMPTKDALNLKGLNISDDAINALLSIYKDEWVNEFTRKDAKGRDQKEFFEQFGEHLPKEILDEYGDLKKRIMEMNDR